MILTTNNPIDFNVDCGYVQSLVVKCASGTAFTNIAYSSSLVAKGGCPPYKFSIISGGLPPGLRLNPNTGAITGTALNTGTFDYVAEVKDGCGHTATTSSEKCSITVPPHSPPAPPCCGSIAPAVLQPLLAF